MEKLPKTTPPGLKFRTRADGQRVPYWIAPPGAAKAGFRPVTVNLRHIAAYPAELAAECHRLANDVKLFLAGQREKTPAIFDGSLRSLFLLYQTHPMSSYQKLAPSSRKTYDGVLPVLTGGYGGRRIDHLSALDVAEWFSRWRNDESGRDKLATARVMLAVLKAALAFGVVARLKGCAELKTSLGEMKFDALPPRTSAPTFAQVTAHIAACHEIGQPSIALADAIQFETTLRQWDVIGQWVPMSDPRPSAILARRTKWIGPTWADVDADLILRWAPSKTMRSSGVVQVLDLKRCPLVMAEIERIAPAERVGPLIKSPAGVPWQHPAFLYQWRKASAKAGLPSSIWSRDLRAGGVTEGRIAGASLDDVRQTAGHSSVRTTTVYDRDKIVAFSRVADARVSSRKGS